jgi:hypothetical protein
VFGVFDIPVGLAFLVVFWKVSGQQVCCDTGGTRGASVRKQVKKSQVARDVSGELYLRCKVSSALNRE